MKRHLHLVTVTDRSDDTTSSFDVTCRCGFETHVAALTRVDAERVGERHLTALAAPSIDELAELLGELA